MKVAFETSISFGRQLTSKEEAEYCDVLKRGKEKAGGGIGKSMLIVPASSLPQNLANNTGVGNLASEEGQKFFDFAKKYWGINEVQILPIGQYHNHSGNYPIYSGTTTDLGNHVIDIKEYVSKEKFNEIVNHNKISDKVNFQNVVEYYSIHESALKELYNNMPDNIKQEFNTYKQANAEHLERKSLYRGLAEIHRNHDYKQWGKIDSNLFNENIVSSANREKRIAEIKTIASDTIDFYKFKQFLADKSLKKAKAELNKKGIKLSGDMPCGFSYDEIWSNPNAFLPNCKNMWNLPVLNYENQEAEKVLREKVRFYAERFDSFRVDAAWQYVTPGYKNEDTGEFFKPNYEDKNLKIIDDEIKKVKGNNYDLSNITYEFSADRKDFSPYESGKTLKEYLKKRTKIYTSEWMNTEKGSADYYINHGWNPNYFIIGASNHDTHEIKPEFTQIDELSRILKIPREKLYSQNEFVKAKLAEPLRTKNNMLFFMNALGLKGQYKDNSDIRLNYVAKIPENYEQYYFHALERGEGFNPMDALEKQFRAQGLDKSNKKLFNKIVKYRKILEGKEEKTPWGKIAIMLCCSALLLYGWYKYLSLKDNQKHS